MMGFLIVAFFRRGDRGRLFTIFFTPSNWGVLRYKIVSEEVMRRNLQGARDQVTEKGEGF